MKSGEALGTPVMISSIFQGITGVGWWVVFWGPKLSDAILKAAKAKMEAEDFGAQERFFCLNLFFNIYVSQQDMNVTVLFFQRKSMCQY